MTTDVDVPGCRGDCAVARGPSGDPRTRPAPVGPASAVPRRARPCSAVRRLAGPGIVSRGPAWRREGHAKVTDTHVSGAGSRGDTDGHPETHPMSSCPVCVRESLSSRTGTCRRTYSVSRTGPWTGTGPAGRGGGAGRAGGRLPPSAPVAGSAELRPTRPLPVLRPPLPVCVACFALVGVAGTFRHRPGQRPPGSGPRDWPLRAD